MYAASHLQLGGLPSGLETQYLPTPGSQSRLGDRWALDPAIANSFDSSPRARDT